MSGLPKRRTNFAKDGPVPWICHFLASLFCHLTELFFIVFGQLGRDFDFDGGQQVATSPASPL
jgi:hypothetical protein